MALLVVLETLTPPERLAFVLHDMFGVPFDEIAPIVGRTPEAARQLASRARRRVQGAAPNPDADLSHQREIVDAFLAASRAGDFDALLAVLDPDVVFRFDAGTSPLARPPITGAPAVARQILARGARFAPHARPALVNGAAGAIVGPEHKPFAVVGFHRRRRPDRRDRRDHRPRQAARPRRRPIEQRPTAAIAAGRRARRARGDCPPALP